MSKLVLTHHEMITLENILQKYVELLNNEKIQREFTMPEILDIRKIYQRVLYQNQKPSKKGNC